MSGLTNGATHYFRVRAVNIAGSGPPSSVVSVVPRTVPSAPRTLIATPTNVSGQVRVSWVAPASNGGTAVTDYAVQRSPNGTSGWVTITDGVNTATAFTVSGLANGTRYYFRVLARNAVGYSPSSNVVNAIPRTIPAAVRSLSVTPAATGQLRLAWLAPASNGGSAITDYLIQRSPNGTTGWVTITDGVSTATAFTVTGLRNGTRYYFRVYPRNAAGYGPASTVVSQIPRPVPTAVRSLTAAPTNVSGQVRLTWVAPASNGGYAVTDYVIQRWNSGAPAWVTISDGVRTTTTYTVTGLANGTRYYFRVFARNAAGSSLPSPSVVAIPRTVPHGAPLADRRADERVGPGATDVGGAGLDRRLGGHRLPHPALTEREDRLGLDQRRCAHDDDAHSHRAGERQPLLLPGLRPQRCRLQPDQRRGERHPANSAWSATQSRGVRRRRGLLAAVGRSGEQRIADHRLHRPGLERTATCGRPIPTVSQPRQRRSSRSPGSAATTSESPPATPPASAPSARSGAASWRSDRSAHRRPNGSIGGERGAGRGLSCRRRSVMSGLWHRNPDPGHAGPELPVVAWVRAQSRA